MRRRFDMPDEFPMIVCLCGSTRFVDTFNEWRIKLTHLGFIVLSIEIVTSQQMETDPQHVNLELKKQLDALHFRKIDLADIIMVLNVGGYVGQSTSREIEYALKTGKYLRFLEPDKAVICIKHCWAPTTSDGRKTCPFCIADPLR